MRHHQAHRGRLPAGAGQVVAQQRGVFEHAFRHERVRAGLKLDVEQHAGAGGPPAARLERRPPRHVRQPLTQVVRDMLRRQSCQLVEVQIVHPVVTKQTGEVRDHAGMGEQPLVGWVVVADRRGHGDKVRQCRHERNGAGLQVVCEIAAILREP